MRERKYVKLRVDMYEDTKFKIIDMKPERDVIYYIWSRIVMLAGKVNLEGDLYLSKNIPYTIETLAIDFNRDLAQIKLALDIFIELQMLELTEDNVYKVRNFAKHQNIKVKEKEVSKTKDLGVNDSNSVLNESLKVEIIAQNDKESDAITVENIAKNNNASNELNLEDNNKTAAIAKDSSNKINLQADGTILLDTQKSRKNGKKKKDSNVTADEILDEDVIDEEVNGFTDGDRPLDKDEIIVLGWSFG
jgi:predicted phage replisome organizer